MSKPSRYTITIEGLESYYSARMIQDSPREAVQCFITDLENALYDDDCCYVDDLVMTVKMPGSVIKVEKEADNA